MKKFFLLALIFIAGFGFVLFFIHQTGPRDNFVQPAPTTDFLEKEITIFAVGDIMLERGVEFMLKKYGNSDWRWPFFQISDELKKADILFGNLEGPISENGEKVGSIYSFRFKPQSVEGLVFAGFDVLSLANNHILDYQRQAMEDTMEILNRNNVDYVGAGFNSEEVSSVKIKEVYPIRNGSSNGVNGTKIGFLAFTDLGSRYWQAGSSSPGVAWINWQGLEDLNEEIKKAKEKVDLLFVSLHSGNEYSQEPTEFQRVFSQRCIDAGADMIIGHHPHVVQKIEKYNNGWIAYSLGNFVFDQNFSEETMEGLLLEIKIYNKEIKEVISHKIEINGFYQPYLLSDETI